MNRPPVPPFTAETAAQKARMAEDAWNSRDPARVALAYTEDSRWRNRSEFLSGRDAIVAFLTRKWARELDYRLIKEVWAFTGARIAVRFAYEFHDDAGLWFEKKRAHGNEQWEFDEHGLMRRREASINAIRRSPRRTGASAGRSGRAPPSTPGSPSSTSEQGSAGGGHHVRRSHGLQRCGVHACGEGHPGAQGLPPGLREHGAPRRLAHRDRRGSRGVHRRPDEFLPRHGERERPALHPAPRRPEGVPAECSIQQTLAFADYRGNRQYISMGNLVENPRVHLFLIDYAQRARVKIWGEARVVEDDPALTASLMPEGYDARPERAFVIHVTALDENCPKHIPVRLDAADVGGDPGRARRHDRAAHGRWCGGSAGERAPPLRAEGARLTCRSRLPTRLAALSQPAASDRPSGLCEQQDVHPR